MLDTTVVMTVAVAAGYFLVLLLIGRLSSRGAGTGKDAYFVANRTLQGVVLFASVFGTNMTAFVMLGLAGQTYRLGLSTWGMLIGACVLTLPVHFYFGYRCWLAARRGGYTSPAEFYRERYASNTLGLLAFVFFTAWTLPVILTGIIGGGRVFEAATGGTVPYWLGALLITAVVAYYTTVGGMRATAWTNLLQTALFFVFFVFAVIWVPAVSGGPGALFERLSAEAPHLIARDWDAGAGWGPAISFFVLFSTANFATPYIWIRMVSARSGRTIRRMATLYPLAVLLVWAPAILLGLWGAVLVPNLQGPDADSVIFALSGALFPTAMVAFGVIGLFAIVMSSMDAQTLTLSNLFTVDVVQRYTRTEPERVVRYARIFVLALLVLLYVVALQPLPAVFGLSTFAFTGFMTFFPLMVGGVLWRRATKAGALASLVVGQAVAIAGYVGLYPPVFGLLPQFWVAVTSWGAFVLVSLLTAPPATEVVERFHGEWDRVWREHPPAGRPLEPEPVTD